MNKRFSWKVFMEDLKEEKEELNIAPAQPSEEHMRQVMQSHIDAINHKGVGATYSSDFKGEDPVGTAPITTGGGDMINELKEIFDVPFTPQRAELISPISTSFGNAAAMAFKLYVDVNGQNISIDIIDVFEFNEQGEVTDQKAYWGKENVTLLD